MAITAAQARCLGPDFLVLIVDVEARQCWCKTVRGRSFHDNLPSSQHCFLLADRKTDGQWRVCVSEKALNGDCFIFRSLGCAVYVKPGSAPYPATDQLHELNPFANVEFEVRDNPWPPRVLTEWRDVPHK